MLSLQNLKRSHLIKQEAATNAATLTSDQLDTIGLHEVVIDVFGTTSNNATNNPATLKIQQADTTDATNFADITAYVGDGAGGFTVPNSPTATTNNAFATFHLRRNQNGWTKRYLRLLVSPVTTQTFSVVAYTGRNEQAPNTLAELGTAVVVGAGISA